MFVGDGHQRIYNRNRASMSACGIDIRGRSRKLYLNYRTTEEIRRLAVAMLEGCEVDDLDEGSDEVRRYKSISHGPQPEVVKVEHLEQGLARAIAWAGEAIKVGRSVCVIVPSGKLVDAVAKSLKSAGVPTAVIGPNERDSPDSVAARVATMHRAKGLEFDEVVLITDKDGSEGERSDPRRLHYLTLTRAKQRALLIRI